MRRIAVQRERLLVDRRGLALRDFEVLCFATTRGARHAFYDSVHAFFGGVSYRPQNTFLFFLVHAVHLPSCDALSVTLSLARGQSLTMTKLCRVRVIGRTNTPPKASSVP
jgi:hypothetical protein